MKPDEKGFSNRNKKRTMHKCPTERGMQEAQRMREETRIFVGRDFSHDINQENVERLQPLKYRFCLCNEILTPRTLRSLAFHLSPRFHLRPPHNLTAAFRFLAPFVALSPRQLAPPRRCPTSLNCLPSARDSQRVGWNIFR